MDAEHIIMTARLWRLLGLDSIALQINTLGTSEDRSRHRKKLIHYLEQHHDCLDEEARRRLHTNPLRVLDSKNPTMQALIEAAPKLLDDLDEVSLKHFEELQAMLRNADVSFEINPRLVRGLDYYNFTVFEWVTERLGAQGTVCAGGRYDGLIEQIGGKAAPACGFAMGVERLLALLEDGGFEAPQQVPDAMCYTWRSRRPDGAAGCGRIARSGIETILHCGGGSFKSQMKKADASVRVMR